MPTQCLPSKEKCWEDLESLFQSHGESEMKWKVLAGAGEMQGAVPAAREWLLRYSADSVDELPWLVCAIAIFSEQGDECAVERVCRWLLMDQSNPSLIEVRSCAVKSTVRSIVIIVVFDVRLLSGHWRSCIDMANRAIQAP